MTKRIIAICVGVLLLASTSYAASSESYGYSALHKLVRGLANSVTAPVEIPRNIYIENQYENMAYGTITGLGKGLFKTLTRFGAGVIDVFTFPVGFPVEFRDPIVEPEYVWQEWY
jgi:putative exosortase-associated protein (TIGR04073 family)